MSYVVRLAIGKVENKKVLSDILVNLGAHYTLLAP